MKNSIKTIFESSIRDNRLYIEQYGGNIAEYYREDFANQDQGHTWYLTDEEIEIWENDEDERERLINEIHDFLDEYYMPVYEFFNQNANNRIFEFIDFAKQKNNYIEVSESVTNELVDDDLDLTSKFVKNLETKIDRKNLVQFAKFDCTTGEQQDDDELISTLAEVGFSEETIVVRVELENDIFNQTQSVYYFLH